MTRDGTAWIRVCSMGLKEFFRSFKQQPSSINDLKKVKIFQKLDPKVQDAVIRFNNERPFPRYCQIYEEKVIDGNSLGVLYLAVRKGDTIYFNKLKVPTTATSYYELEELADVLKAKLMEEVLLT
jgi:hypothetical protein